MGGVASVCRPTSWAGPRPSRKSLNWASEESLTPGKMRLKEKRLHMLPEKDVECTFADSGQSCSPWHVMRVRSKTTEQIDHKSCVLTFPRSCSCSCCRLWTPCWPAESSCSSSPLPGPSLCSSESCCVTSFLLLLHAQTHMKREKRRRERRGDKRLSVHDTEWLCDSAIRMHRDYFCDTSASIDLLKNHCRGKKNNNTKTTLWMKTFSATEKC